MNSSPFTPHAAAPIQAAAGQPPLSRFGAAIDAMAAQAMAQLDDQLAQLAPEPGQEAPEGLAQARLRASAQRDEVSASFGSQAVRAPGARALASSTALSALVVGKALNLKFSPKARPPKKDQRPTDPHEQARQEAARARALQSARAPERHHEAMEDEEPASALLGPLGSLGSKLRDRRPEPAPKPKLAPFFLTLPT